MSNLNKTLSQIWLDDYVVPLYQRNYAWQESQIQQLLQDIYDNSNISDNSKSPEYNPQNETFRHSRTSRLFS